MLLLLNQNKTVDYYNIYLNWAGSLNQWVLPLSMPLPLPVLPIEHGSLNGSGETETLEAHWQW